jgi:hypothetical protein
VAETDPKAVGSISDKDRQFLWREITQRRMLDVHKNDKGNMTSFVRIRAGARVYEISWPTAFGPTSPDSLVRLEEFLKLCEKTAKDAQAPARP